MATKEYHWGNITDVDDPERRGRVCVSCPTIAQDDVLEWVEPCFHFVDNAGNAGAFWVPSVGSMVEVEIEDNVDGGGSPDLGPKWRCAVYPEGSVPDEFSDQSSYPYRRGWKTRAGHVFYFDDTDGCETFYYKHPSGTEILVDSNGKIKLRGEVEIGVDPTEACVLGNALQSYFNAAVTGVVARYNTHTHSGHGVATLDTITPMPNSVLSSTNKVK